MEEQTLVVGARTTLRVRDNKKATIKGPRGKTVLACDDPNARYELHMRIVRRTNCKKMNTYASCSAIQLQDMRSKRVMFDDQICRKIGWGVMVPHDSTSSETDA